METSDLKKYGGIAAIVIIGLLIGAYKLGYLDHFTTPSNNNVPVQNTSGSSSPSPTTLQDVRTVDNSSAVGITAPPAPINGKIRSISMIGPSGVYNAITLRDGKNFKLVKKAFTPKLINEQFVSTDDIKSVLAEYIKDSWNNGVTSNSDIQIVIASSVATNPKIQAMIPELKKTYVVTTTTSDTEGEGGFRVAVAPQYVSTATVMDITPTIIRFSYNTGGNIKTIVAKTGSKFYQNNQTEDQALAEIRQVISQIPRNSQQLFIVLWAAAEKDLRQGDNRYSGIPTYTGNEKSTQSGLRLINEVKALTNANVVLDYESMWFMSY